jgi:hypothetical protein
MQHWKRLELDNLELIVEQTLNYIKNHTTLLDQSTFKGPFISFKEDHFISEVPELARSFAKHGLHYEAASVYVMWSNEQSFPHKDYTDSIGRINIPILNCSGSSTVFYKDVQGRRMVLPTGAPFYLTMNRKSLIQVDSVEINQPTIVRICEGHDVILPDNMPVPRITLTVSTAPDCGLLLDD